ncbi:MAG: hypothetical protein E6Q97_09195 [Desulfurellales bacterium]|nr:MAG: hypothetical protein E6Q97_09195 [Desulfurellales bacterium]
MTAPAKKIFTVGLNAVRIYEIDQDDGSVASTNATAYDGLSVGGPVTFSYEAPDFERIAHPGNNIVLQTDALPSLEASTASLEVSRSDMDTIAALTNVNVHNIVTDINAIAWQTNQQGTEPTVALLTYAQAKTNSGTRAWSTFIFPKAIIIPKPKGMSREQANHTYFVQPQSASKHLYGVALNITDDGCTNAEVIEYQSNYRLHVAGWTTTATETAYTFDTSLPYTNNAGAGIIVTKNGVKMTYGATADTTHYTATASGITFGAALTNGDKVVALYELADSAVDVE